AGPGSSWRGSSCWSSGPWLSPHSATSRWCRDSVARSSRARTRRTRSGGSRGSTGSCCCSRSRSPTWVWRCRGPEHRPEASSQRGDAEVARDSVALGDEDGGERETVLSPPPLALELRFSSDVDPLLPLGARGRLQRLEHVVHVALELLDRPESRRSSSPCRARTARGGRRARRRRSGSC